MKKMQSYGIRNLGDEGAWAEECRPFLRPNVHLTLFQVVLIPVFKISLPTIRDYISKTKIFSSLIADLLKNVSPSPNENILSITLKKKKVKTMSLKKISLFRMKGLFDKVFITSLCFYCSAKEPRVSKVKILFLFQLQLRPATY